MTGVGRKTGRRKGADGVLHVLEAESVLYGVV